MRTVLTFALAIAATCLRAQTVVDGSSDGVPPDAIASVIASMSKELADPRSLQLRKLTYDRPRRIICGEFNARGAGGGYEPYRQFVATPAVLIIVPPPGEFLHDYHKREAARLCP